MVFWVEAVAVAVALPYNGNSKWVGLKIHSSSVQLVKVVLDTVAPVEHVKVCHNGVLYIGHM